MGCFFPFYNNPKTLDLSYKTDVDFYAPAYWKNWGRALSVTPFRPIRPSVCPSVRPYVPLSCPGHNSKTLRNIFMKLHRCIHPNKTMCHEQGRQLLHFHAPAYSKNSGRALSVTPVRPIRPSVCPSVRPTFVSRP